MDQGPREEVPQEEEAIGVASLHTTLEDPLDICSCIPVEDRPLYAEHGALHTEKQHTNCHSFGGYGEYCGGCDSCLAMQDRYWKSRRAEQALTLGVIE